MLLKDGVRTGVEDPDIAIGESAELSFDPPREIHGLL